MMRSRTGSNLEDYPHLADISRRVKHYVSQHLPHLAFVRLSPCCPEIRSERRKRGYRGSRALMHVGHVKNVICAWAPAVERLSEGYVVGLLLHEFGHVVAGESEVRADLWPLLTFGIPITYRGPNLIEWVDPKLIAEKGI